MAMSFKDLGACPTAIPIPEFDEHIIRAGEDDRESGMDSDMANVIGVSFKLFDLVHGVVVVDTDHHVISAANHPLFTGNELGSTDCRFGEEKERERKSKKEVAVVEKGLL
jgi:hypothetical protein